MPGSVAQCLISLRETISSVPVFQGLAVGAEEALSMITADGVIPPGASKDIVLLVEAFEVSQDFKTGFHVFCMLIVGVRWGASNRILRSRQGEILTNTLKVKHQ